MKFKLHVFPFATHSFQIICIYSIFFFNHPIRRRMPPSLRTIDVCKTCQVISSTRTPIKNHPPRRRNFQGVSLAGRIRSDEMTSRCSRQQDPPARLHCVPRPQNDPRQSATTATERVTPMQWRVRCIRGGNYVAICLPRRCDYARAPFDKCRFDCVGGRCFKAVRESYNGKICG